MFSAKSGMRLFALSIVSAVAFSITAGLVPASAWLSPASAHEGHSQDEAIAFLQGKFVEGKYLEGFTPGQPDYGFTLEALIQLKLAGADLTPVMAAVREVSYNAAGFSEAISKGENFNPGLAAKYIFAAKVLESPNRELCDAAALKLEGTLDENGAIKGREGLVFDHAWAILGLRATGRNDAALRVEQYLWTLQEADGGFNTGDEFASDGVSTTDASGIALQALAAMTGQGPAEAAAERELLIDDLRAFLLGTQVESSHWEGFGSVDVNGTAYAAMGLAAAGEDTEAIANWLEQQQAADGGLATPWSEGSGDTYATAQALAPMAEVNYVDVVRSVDSSWMQAWIPVAIALIVLLGIAGAVLLIARSRRSQ